MLAALVTGFLMSPPCCWSQPAGKADANAAKAAYEQARQKEQAGDVYGALERYRLVAEDYPTTEWAGLANERVAAISARMQPPPGVNASFMILAWLFSIFEWIVGLLVVSLLFGFLGYRAGWFWRWALLARVGDSVEGAMSRFRSRRALERELQARKANPRDARARHALGVMYFKGRRYEHAAEELAEAVSLDPDRVDAQYHLGLTYLRLHRPQEALAPLQQVVARKPTHGGDAMVRLAEAKLATGDATGAEAVAREAVEKQPMDAETRYTLALALDALGQREHVPELLQQAVSLGRRYRGVRRRENLSVARRARAYLRSRRQ